MKFKTRTICTAVAAAVGTFAGAAQAVNLGADGQGQVLLYPYYTVQTKGSTAFDTYFSIVNTDSFRGKAVKVRFIEGKNSKEVLDFNLYLSPNDVFAGAITATSDGAKLNVWADNSCTAPEIPIISGTGATQLRSVSFVNYGYTGGNDDAAEDGLSRTREGYIEVIQMGDLIPGLRTNFPTPATGLDTFAAALHTGGVPGNCNAIRAAWNTGALADYATPANDGIGVPTGGLNGSATIINPAEGTDMTYDAVAIDNFSNLANHQAPGDILPNLANVVPSISDVFDGARLVRTDWSADIALSTVASVAPVSAVLMRNQVLNEYAIGAQPVAYGTDWVMTFPTKALHLRLGNALDEGAVGPAGDITQPFRDQAFTVNGACETITLTAYDRAEQFRVTPGGFSPPPPTGAQQCLPWEANVLSINKDAGGPASNVFGSLTLRGTREVGFTEGWIRVSFNNTAGGWSNTMTSAAGVSTQYALGAAASSALANPVVYTGLPVTGFAGLSYQNTTTLTNYGGTYIHKYTRMITP